MSEFFEIHLQLPNGRPKHVLMVYKDGVKRNKTDALRDYRSKRPNEHSKLTYLSDGNNGMEIFVKQ